MERYDAVIVGARVAGAATALQLARRGHRVLVLDHARRGSDTLSTHALMPAGVELLDRWRLLDRLTAAGTPPIHQVTFHYGDEAVPVAARRPLYAPKRTVLDPLLVDAAEEAGAEFQFGVAVDDVVRDAHGRVIAVEAHDRGGRRWSTRARVVVGADGRGSRVAAAVGAPVTHTGRHASACVYGYWADVPTEGYHWCFAPGAGAGLIPTNDGDTVVFVAVPPARFHAELRHDLARAVPRLLAEITSDAADRLAAGRQVGRVRGFPGVPGWLRQPCGPGWALVGDAAYFKDPLTAHGMTDALRDADLLSRALDAAWTGAVAEADALDGYARLRDTLSAPLFATSDVIASYRWDLPALRAHHLALSDAMKHEGQVLRALARDGVEATPSAAA